MSSEMRISLSLDAFESVCSEEPHRTQQGAAVLQGLHVYLDVASETSQEISALCATLLSLGASVTLESSSFRLGEGITHVVSNNHGVQNCAKALRLKPRPLLVSASWVLEYDVLCSAQRKHVSEAPYLLYNLKEELGLANMQTKEKRSKDRLKSFRRVSGGSKKKLSEVGGDTGQLNMAFQGLHIKPVAVKTKSITLDELQLMPTPPELVNRRKHVRRNIATSALSETSKKLLRERIKKLGLYEYKRKVDDDTKVLVADDKGTVTSNLLKALVLGIGIVSEDWVNNSWKRGCWLHPSFKYYVEKWRPIYKRHNYRGMRRLLNGSQLFYVSTGCSLPHETLTFLISHAGAKVTERVSEADVVIARSKPSSDIIKCISNNKPVAVVVTQWLIGEF
ncbi:unnamed protein product [Toxocara canis]|uniref:BRCT domain-containing protein n=1 Tax=Toxocara canis TaxID=6265 RepID=A0A183TVL3_TOXCA|nr:unnamed protein product [Toxocara canis]